MERHGTVYVVDDDDMVRRSCVFALSTAGYDAQPFDNGRDFVGQMAALPSGCVLLDIRMPVMDGLQVLDAYGGHRDRFPTVVMTGHGDITTAVNAMKHGAADFVEKPFDEQIVLEMLDGLFLTLDTRVRSNVERSDAERRLQALTTREMDVLRGLVSGLPNKLVADQLGISVRTVEMHRANLMDKLDVKALADVLRLAFRAGIVVV